MFCRVFGAVNNTMIKQVFRFFQTNFRLRINNHKSCIANGRLSRGCRLHEHSAQDDHNVFTVTIVDSCSSGNMNVRECHWITKLKSMYPADLNCVDDKDKDKEGLNRFFSHQAL